MNYKKHYLNLIENAQNREVSGYTERHHIVPRCIGGNDDASNLVSLTAREHFIAHLLLMKMYPDKQGLVKAVVMMCCGHYERKVNNRIYEWVRVKFSKVQSDSQSGNKNSQYGTAWINNPETGESRKVKKYDTLPDGWEWGRYKQLKPKPQVKMSKKLQYVELYSDYYKLYSNLGFDKFVDETGYSKSQANLVQMFSRHVPEYVPQNGKQRG